MDYNKINLIFIYFDKLFFSMAKRRKLREVYVGHGRGMEAAAGLINEISLSLNIGGNKAAERCLFAKEYIGRILNPTEMFVIYHSYARIPEVMCARVDADRPYPMSAVKEYSIEELNQYLSTAIALNQKIIPDHIVVAKEDLIKRVVSEIKKLGHKPITFQ